jgi:Ca2+-binding EF-hand superfamily protein
MSSIGSIGSNNSSLMMQGMRQRPDTAKMAENLFSQLDTSGQGYIEKSGLQAALDKISSGSSGSSTSVDDLFTALDTDGNGQVTKQEFTNALTKLQDNLETQYLDSRMQAAREAGGMGGMPPPPPPPGEGPTLSKDELTSMVNELGTSDSRSNMMSNILENFDKADTDGDGKVSFQEAKAFEQSSSSSGSTAGTSSSVSSSNASEEKAMMQIMKLMQAYNIGNDPSQYGGLGSTLSVSA